jgi:hypothetical protein
MNRASQPQHGAEAGPTRKAPTHEAEEQDMGATVATDRSLEEMASDLRNLTGQVMTARVMGLPQGHADAVPAATPAVRLVGEMLSDEIARALEHHGAEQRKAMASLLVDHSQGMRATVERVDRLLRRIEQERDQWNADQERLHTDRERDALAERHLLNRLEAIAAKQQQLETLLRERDRTLIPAWLSAVVALAALGVSIGLVASLHFGIQP